MRLIQETHPVKAISRESLNKLLKYQDTGRIAIRLIDSILLINNIMHARKNPHKKTQTCTHYSILFSLFIITR